MPIEEAFDAAKIKRVSFDFDYYLAHLDELERDLGPPIDKDHVQTAPKEELKQLSDELFYRLMCQIFGGPLDLDDNKNQNQASGKGKKCMLTDFRMLSEDGNATHITAKRGQFYFIFSFISY